MSASPLRPADLSFAVGIPVDRDSYGVSVDRVNEQNVVRAQHLSWHQYEREIVLPFAEESRRWRACGATVHTHVGLDSLDVLFRDGGPGVLVLISHAWQDQIELIDGMVPHVELVKRVPPDFGGTFDLCICNSLPLAQRIKQERPRSIVKFSHRPAHYTYWIKMYSVLLALLAKQSFVYYADAMEAAIKHVRG